MSRVAVNQDRTQAERKHFTFVQHVRVLSRKGSKAMCEEVTDSRVTPGEKGQQQTLLSLQGRAVARSGEVVVYHEPPAKPAKAAESPGKDKAEDGDSVVLKDAAHGGREVTVPDTDVDLVEHMRDNLLKEDSKDGMAEGLFPLTTEHQREMRFVLKGRESRNGRDCFHIAFAPKDDSDFDWKGDAWIDAAAFEPVVIRTALSRKIPLAVRLMLGTNLPGLGFTAVYAPQADSGGQEVWFPASFGTEFKVNVLFMFHRQIVLSAENRDFERTHVSATLHEAEGAGTAQ